MGRNLGSVNYGHELYVANLSHVQHNPKRLVTPAMRIASANCLEDGDKCKDMDELFETKQLYIILAEIDPFTMGGQIGNVGSQGEGDVWLRAGQDFSGVPKTYLTLSPSLPITS